MNPETDKSFDRVLAESLRAADREPATDCPDAEVLGAYFEHTLRPWAERARVEAHLATCPRCRDVLVDLGKAAKPSPEHAAGFWPRWVPAFGTLAAATVAVVLAVRLFPETQQAELAAPPPSVTEESSRFRENPDAALGSRPDVLEPRDAKQELGRNAEKKARSEVAAAKPAAQAKTKDLRDEETDTATSARRQKRAAAGEPRRALEDEDRERAPQAAAPPAAPAPQTDALENRFPATTGTSASRPAKVESAPAEGGALGLDAREEHAAVATPPPLAKEAQTENERANVAQAPAPPESADDAKPDAAKLEETDERPGGPLGGLAALARAPAREPAASADARAQSASAPEAEHVASAGARDDSTPPFQWRLGKDGVERSDDGGTTWASVALPADAKIVAVSSPHPPVAWAVGEKGVVLRTLDGRTWQRVPAATEEDLVSVFAKSADTATITTRSGHVFETKSPATGQAR